MKKNIILKVVSVIVSIIFVFSAGLFIGVNFYSIKNYLFTGSSNDISESRVGFLDAGSDDTGRKFSVKPIEETINLVYENALTKKSKQELLGAAIKGVLAELNDRYAEYFNPEEYRQVMESYSGTMSGIGIIITVDDEGDVVVVKPLKDTPAYRAGLKEGDIIVKVDGKEITGMSLEKVVALVRGEEGTNVSLIIYRPGENKTFEVNITRERFYVPNLFSKMLEGNIGYIQYINFQEQGAQKLDEEIQKLIDSGAEGIIFDLRNNLGGLLDDAVEVCDLFLDQGIIVTVKGRSEIKESLDEYRAEEGKYTKIPLVVLINEYSASASELVAGALRDNGRAVLVGERSFGKGTVQVLKELSDGSGIKFTTAKYYLPSGVSVEGSGINPDIVVKYDPASKEDVQLNRAIEEIKSLVGSSKSE